MQTRILVAAIAFSVLQPSIAAQQLATIDNVPGKIQSKETVTVPSKQDLKFQQEVESSTKWYTFAKDALLNKSTAYSKDIKLTSGLIISMSFAKEPKSPILLSLGLWKTDANGDLKNQFSMMRELNIDAAFLIAKAKLDDAFWKLWVQDPLGILDPTI